MTDKPNCSTCDNDYCPNADKHDNAYKDWGAEASRQECKRLTKERGCLSHPGAREYLMADVIKELKHKQANAMGEISHKYLEQDTYREGIIKTCREAIALIRGVKE